MTDTGRVWLVTGASSGFGRGLAEAALRNNENVVAASSCRTPADLDGLAAANPERLLVVKCDVTKADDVVAVFARGIERFGRVDVVFNNAGLVMVSEIEGTRESQHAARELFEVNFWGVLAVSREAVRVFRDLNPAGAGGRLLNVSSGFGFVGMPVVGMYCASKFAVEGFTESLRQELDPAWNIKVSIIAPGAFNTGLHTDRTPQFPVPPAYSGAGVPSQAVRDAFRTGSFVHGIADRAVEAMFKFSKLESPPARWAVGKDSIQGTRAKIEQVSKEVDAFESWSDNLQLPH
ncbi:NAD(P)-binding protein [Mycena pura]|uniref:NAD(P)-binding protein n=1 Tax=Mycena pura TaxID=153505 RepID=A0AAD6YFI8_9AGAR|nr:NAD(P)-binding protein [Mycena pura]